MQINIYCDESCHLERDGHPHMVLGAIACPATKVRAIAERIREIKSGNGLPPYSELKWGRVSPSRVQCYKDVVDYFFDDDDLSFRAVVAAKGGLDHAKYQQSHDDWYYKMHFQLLSKMLSPENRYRIFIDIKDTRGAIKCNKLREVLCNNALDFNHRIVENVQNVRSHEVEQIQLADLFAGVLSYVNRGLLSSEAKTSLVERVKHRSRYSLTRSTLLGESKFNLFHWTGAQFV